MRVLPLLVVFFLFAVGAPAIADDAVGAAQAKFEDACEQCHYSDDFVEDAESVIEAMILAIMSGETKHRGDFSDLSNIDASNLAAFLAEQ